MEELNLIDYIDNVIKRLEYLKKMYLRKDISKKLACNKVIYILESRAKWILEDM